MKAVQAALSIPRFYLAWTDLLLSNNFQLDNLCEISWLVFRYEILTLFCDLITIVVRLLLGCHSTV